MRLINKKTKKTIFELENKKFCIMLIVLLIFFSTAAYFAIDKYTITTISYITCSDNTIENITDDRKLYCNDEWIYTGNELKKNIKIKPTFILNP